MRLRTIKPGFFHNDTLATLPPITRLLFAGLWCYADREGRFEWRPLRIKAEVLPYDNCDIAPMLDALEKAGFLRSYTDASVKYGVVVAFATHQRPHQNEQCSTLPAPPEGPFQGSTTLVVPQHNLGSAMDAQSLGSGVLGVGSGNLGQETGSATTVAMADPPSAGKAPRKKAVGDHPELVDYFVSSYERLLGTKYPMSAKDGAAVSRLLKDFSASDIRQRMHMWLTTDDPWISSTDRSLSLFASKVNTPAVRGVVPVNVAKYGNLENNMANIARAAARLSASQETEP